MAATARSITSWTQLLLNALESNSHLKHASFFQLATIGSDGRPSNRTVVFRGFTENTDKIQINTDSRTRKIEELKQCSFAEICWYFTDTWEQFRINGRVDVIDGSNSDPMKLQLREKSWFAASTKSRLQYLGPIPGLPCLIDQPSNELSLDPSSGPVAAFCLLLLDPLQFFQDYAVEWNLGAKFDAFGCFTGKKIHFLKAVALYCHFLSNQLIRDNESLRFLCRSRQ